MTLEPEPQSAPERSLRAAPSPRELLRTLHALSLGALLGVLLIRITRTGRDRSP